MNLAGLSIRVRMLRSLPERFKVDIKVREGSHASENAGAFIFTTSEPVVPMTNDGSSVNRQLNDKERVAGTSSNRLGSDVQTLILAEQLLSRTLIFLG